MKINAAGIDDQAFVSKLIDEGMSLVKECHIKEEEILHIVNQKIAEL